MDKYSSTNVPPVDGYCDVLNYGVYLTRFFVDYTLYGVQHHIGSGVFAVLQERRIMVPRFAKNITLTIQAAALPFVWGNIFQESYTTVDQRCFLSWGVTFYPVVKSIPCTSPGLIKEFFSNGLFIPTDFFNRPHSV
ncbi:hypothetical protein [Clostridium botulinum]|uniref:Uncharacterized protein n=1 Tax=Clostridium botulinum TaxID=1491 RepID=A0A9Q1ZCR2_CLOBO|nr:hypothetical protein [Clostridium botulinum]AEB76864.1 hypothetical protein CbC4_2199 [Clostridium botulinum BKT015925]KEI03030.1 hypothetical protein Y848_06130 [Clostridium botulinum C/D str. Sp77]KLU77076.1 hypothetical protein CBC3_00310 [Clostridium botulinum V891]KOA74501.1 hypothetical protein ADU77_12045 [Clostridium botulinum]KOA84814.1 hypothetical protein ADU80_09045 [Clostridium botulinum]